MMGDETADFSNNYYVQLTPRFENRSFGVYMPFAYDNVFDLNAGLSLRWKGIVIGSSNIFSRWFYPKNKQIDNVYLALKIPILKPGFKDIKKKKRMRESPEWRYLNERIM